MRPTAGKREGSACAAASCARLPARATPLLSAVHVPPSGSLRGNNLTEEGERAIKAAAGAGVDVYC